MSASPVRRVAVVGAGAAGLAAAHALRRRGHAPTVFERNGHVGGKCRTVSFEGRTYEMGATVFSWSGRDLRRLMAEAGVRGTRVRGEGAYVEQGGSAIRTMAPVRRDRAWLGLAASAVRLARELLRHRRLLRPGLAGLDAGLSAPFSRWAAAHRLDDMARLFEPWFTGFGYGYFDEMPAAYVLKYIPFYTPPLLYDFLDGGHQDLWERVARTVDVRLGTEVRRIERGQAAVVVHTRDGRHDFDDVIVASPLDESLRLLDADDEETALFSRIRHHRYVSTLAAVEGPALPRWGFFMENLAPARRGRPMFWYRRWPDRPVATFFTMAGPDEGRDRLVQAIDASLRPLGPQLGAVLAQHAWRYCPHVGAEDLAARWFDRVESLQGRRRTFYCGEALSFGLVGHTVSYSTRLVERYHSSLPDG